MSFKGVAVAGLAFAVVIVVNMAAQMETGHSLGTQLNLILLVVLWIASSLPGWLRAKSPPQAETSESLRAARRTRSSERPRWVEASAAAPAPIAFTNCWLHKPIRLDEPITTPMGSKASSLTISVDFSYDVTPSGSVRVFEARLARGGSALDGSDLETNAATTRGEAFHWDARLDPEQLRAMIVAEIENENGRLAKMLAAKWRGAIYSRS